MPTRDSINVEGAICTNQHDLLVSVLIAGGGINAEALKAKGAKGKIADVYFPHEGWVFEVKSLETDRPNERAVQQQVGQRLASDAPIFGGPIVYGQQRIDLTALPEPTAKNVMRVIGMNVQDAVKTANRQIKATKKVLGKEALLGCLAIVCPPHELDQDVIPFLVGDAIRGGRYAAVNMILVAHTPLLAPFGRQAGSSSLLMQGRAGIRPSESLTRSIGQAWASVHGQPLIYGQPERRGR